MSKKKKSALICAAVILLIAVTAGILIYHNNAARVQKPFYGMLPADIKSVSVYSADGKNILYNCPENEVSHLLSMLTNMEISGKGTDDYKNYIDDNFKMFKIVFADGTVTDLTAVSNSIILNEKAYRADAELLSKICDYYDGIFSYVTPFWDLTENDVKEISFYSLNNDTETVIYTLDSSEISDMVNLLKEITIYGEDKYVYVGGGYTLFKLKKTDGTVLTIDISTFCITVNGQQYKIDYDDGAVKELVKLFNEYNAKYYVPVNAEK